MAKDEREKNRDIIVGPDMMQQIWEIVRSNRASGRPSMARLTVNDEGGVTEVFEVKIKRKEEEREEDDAS